MLLRLGLENLGSFRDRVELSFVSTALSDPPDLRMQHPAAPDGVLPVVAVFGANASGKSNLFRGLSQLWREVRDSFKRDVGGLIPRVPFLLRKDARDVSSRLDVDFTLEDDRVHYGFVFDDRQIIEEWMTLWRGSTRRQSQLFHRHGEDRRTWHFSRELSGANRRIAEVTRAECLFFSKAAAENHPTLKPLHEAFSALMMVQSVDLINMTELHTSSAPILRAENRDLVRRLLRVADLGIEDLRVRDPETTRVVVAQRLSAQGMPDDEIEQVARMLSEGPDPHLIELGHSGESGVEFLSPDLESVGTQSLLRLLNPVLWALSRGGVLAIDELGSGLHPRLVTELVGLFTHADSNPKGAQLLFTTHDSQIVDALRRDEIVLVDKGRDGASALRSLSEFKIRKRDDWRKALELGFVGGVPTVGSMSDELCRSWPHS